MSLRPVHRSVFCTMLAAAASAQAQPEIAVPDVTYPELPAAAATPQDFVPAGWVLETEGRTDLDRDGREDFALVLRMQDPRNIVANEEGLGTIRVDTNPRMLVVGVQDGDGRYRLHTANHTLITRHINPTIDDPYIDAIAEGRVLKVSLELWANAGSWFTSTTTFTFRIDSGCLRMIGYDWHETHRARDERNAISVNYLTGRMKRSSRSPEADAEETWHELHGPQRVCIDAIGDGLTFTPK